MNDRIKELAEQAHVYADGHSLFCHASDIKTFAELIVRECATLAFDGPNGILEHFGVEE